MNGSGLPRNIFEIYTVVFSITGKTLLLSTFARFKSTTNIFVDERNRRMIRVVSEQSPAQSRFIESRALRLLFDYKIYRRAINPHRF